MHFVCSFIDVYLFTLFVLGLGGFGFGGYAPCILEPEKNPSMLGYFIKKWLPGCACVSLLIPIIFVLLLGLRVPKSISQEIANNIVRMVATYF